jgi:hypothetical protein
LHTLKVEPQPAAWASEPDGAERVRVGIDPIALDAKQLREFGGIHEPARGSSVLRCDQVGDLPCDLLDVGGVEPHRRAPP